MKWQLFYIPDNDFFKELKDIVENGDEIYYVEGAAILAIAGYKDNRAFDILKIHGFDGNDTFNDIIPRRAISASAKFSDTHETNIRKSETFSLEKQATKILFLCELLQRLSGRFSYWKR